MNDTPDEIIDDTLTGSGLAAEKAKRLAKVDEIRTSGQEPYPYRFDRSHTLAEVRAESPTRQKPHCPAHIWVGAMERPAFLWQARTLSEAWGCPWTPEPNHHHFSIIDGLRDPNSPLIATCLNGL